ncbi:MAG TPA: glycosyltransferase family 2 protein [Candidatus Saccharimonadia bacterium]
MPAVKQQLKVTVLVLCWNNQDLLGECFKSIFDQSYDNFDVIMVDNGSKDSSVAFTRKHFPKVRLIETGKNNGFAIGNNIGIKEALKDSDCQYIVLLNTDATLRKDWLEKMVEFAENHPRLGSAQSPTLDYFDHDILDSNGICMDRWGLATQIGYRQSNVRYETQRVFGVNAAAAIFSRAFLEEQPFGDDYLDHDLWMYLEDVDLAARATMMGWESWVVAETFAYHMGSASSAKLPGAFSLYMTYRNNALVLIKNFPWRIILRTLPGLFRAEAYRIRGFLRERKYGLIKAMVMGRLRSLPLFPLFLIKRGKLKKYWKIDSTELWELMKAPRLPKLPPAKRRFGSEAVAVVVVSHNNATTIEACLNALKSQEYPNLEIIVVDNISTDGTTKIIKEKYPEITLLEPKLDLGFANGFNVGLTRVLPDNPEYFALIRATAMVGNGWLKQMIEIMHEKPMAFAVSSRLETPDGSVYNQGFTFHPVAGANPKTFEGNKTREVFAASDYASFFRTDKLTLIGLLDGDFFDGLEDVDLCMRARLMGYEVWSNPMAKVIVNPIEPSRKRLWYQTQKNLMLMFLKNMPAKLFWKYLPAMVASQVAATGRSISEGYLPQQTKAFAKVVFRLPRMMRLRNRTNRHKRRLQQELDKKIGLEALRLEL